MLLDISEKIEPAIATVLIDLATLANDSDIPFLVVGAMARDIILDYGFGIAVGRATRDIDFGIRVANWDEFARLVQLLIDENWHCPPKQQHRFVHQIGIPIDLIPFGAIESEAGEIHWPAHFDETLSVIGFADAYANAWQARIRAAPALDVPVASPAGQALLKLAAWRDRGFIRGGRDAIDLRLLMERYLDLDNIARVAEEHLDWLDDDFDYPMVGAKLLGLDVGQCVDRTQSAVFATLIGTLRPEKVESRLAFSMHRFAEDQDLLYCQRLVDAFCSTLPVRDGAS